MFRGVVRDWWEDMAPSTHTYTHRVWFAYVVDLVTQGYRILLEMRRLTGQEQIWHISA